MENPYRRLPIDGKGIQLAEEEIEIGALSRGVLDPVAVQPGESVIRDTPMLRRRGQGQEEGQDKDQSLFHLFMKDLTFAAGRDLRRS